MQQGEFPVGGNGAGEIVRGQVKWFNAVKGFGFVRPEDGSGDVFLHLTCLRDYGRDSVAEGTTIECEVTQRAKGKQAVRILNLDPSTAQPEDKLTRVNGSGPAPDSGWTGRPPRRDSRGGEVERGRYDRSSGFRRGGFDAAAPGAPQPETGFARSHPPRDARAAGPAGDEERSNRPPRRMTEVVAEGDFMTATVKWFNPVRGYGFVLCPEHPQDVFLHMEILRRAGMRDLQPGQEIEIRVGQGPKGLQVAEVRVSG